MDACTLVDARTPMGGQHHAPQGDSTENYAYRGMGCRERWPQLFEAMADFEAERRELAGTSQPSF